MYIIAEIAQGFEGDLNLCKKFVQLAKKSKANAVKFQIFKAEELCTPDYQYYNLFRNLEMPYSQWDEVIRYSEELQIDFLADVFGEKTYEWIKNTNAKGIKIHSSDIKNYSFLKTISSYHGDLYLSVGGSYLPEIQKACEILPQKNLVLLTGFQAEPNQYSDVELDKISYLHDMFKLPIGYADHIDALDPLAISLPAMAVLKGASYIEKHLTIERDFLNLEDSISALNPKEFSQMVELVEKINQFTTTPKTYVLSQREENYRINTKKIPLARRQIMAGEKLRGEDLTLLRIGKNIPKILDIQDLIGRKVVQDISLFSPIIMEHLE